MLDGIEGTVGEDGETHGGIVRKTWQDYEHGKTSPITDLRDLEERFRSGDTYKDMNSIVRRKFDRMVTASKIRYLDMANRMYDRLETERKKFFDARADAVGDRKVETVMMAKGEDGKIDDSAFEAVAREESMRKVGRRMTRFMENPEVIDDPNSTPESIKWKDERFAEEFWNMQKDELRKLSIRRCERMAETASMNKPEWVGGQLVSSYEMIDAAEAYAKNLSEEKTLSDGTHVPARITPDEAKALGYKCIQARSQLDDRIRREIAAKSANVLAHGDLKTLEAAEKQFAATAKGFADGSVGQTAALVAQKQIAEKADNRAAYDLMCAIVDDDLIETADGTPVFDPKTQERFVRLYPEVKAAFDKKVRMKTRAEHDDNLLVAKLKMMEFAGRGDAQGYYDWLAKAVIDKRLYGSDFTKLRTEYANGWINGYKGQQGQVPKQMQLAGSMLDIIKTETGVDFKPYMKRDERGELNPDKDGRIVVDPTAKDTPSLEYERPGNWLYDPDEKFSTKEVADLINMSLSMANMDGREVPFDPVTGERLEGGKTHKVNALSDFKAFVTRIREQKNVVAAAEEMARRTTYMNNIRAEALNADTRRMAEMTNSKPVNEPSKKEESEEQ